MGITKGFMARNEFSMLHTNKVRASQSQVKVFGTKRHIFSSIMLCISFMLTSKLLRFICFVLRELSVIKTRAHSL